MRGRDKLTQKIDGIPLLTRMCHSALATGLQTFVTLPYKNHPRAPLIDAATPVFIPDATDGMAASIRRGVSALSPDVAGVMILPSDMPEIERDDLQKVADAFDPNDAAVVRATATDGTPGHPVVFPRRLFAALGSLSGDQGARSVLTGQPITLVPLPGRRACVDLDTPEAWEAWRATRNQNFN